VDGTTTFGMTPAKVADLLRMGLSGHHDGGSFEDQAAAWLADWLAAGVAADGSIPALGLSLQVDGEPVDAPDGESIGELLCRAGTSPGVIEAIKRCAKRRAGGEASSPQTAAAGVVYYAAIASALVFQNRSITRHSREVLAKGFEDLCRQRWIPPDIIGLLTEAAGRCRADEKT